MTYLAQLKGIREKFLGIDHILGATTTLPKGFHIDSALSLLDSGSNSKDMGMHLAAAFPWSDSPQGFVYWSRVYDSLPLMSPFAITQIKVWAIAAILNQLTSEQ